MFFRVFDYDLLNDAPFLAGHSTKRYSMPRIKRAMLHSLLEINQADTDRLHRDLPLFVRPLAMGECGGRILSLISRTSALPLLNDAPFLAGHSTQSQRKNPTLAIPSTMIIIPATNTIVSQLMPLEVSADCPAVYQK